MAAIRGRERLEVDVYPGWPLAARGIGVGRRAEGVKGTVAVGWDWVDGGLAGGKSGDERRQAIGSSSGKGSQLQGSPMMDVAVVDEQGERLLYE